MMTLRRFAVSSAVVVAVLAAPVSAMAVDNPNYPASTPTPTITTSTETPTPNSTPSQESESPSAPVTSSAGGAEVETPSKSAAVVGGGVSGGTVKPVAVSANDLPHTGASVLPLLALGGALVAGGGALTVVSRRKGSQH